MLIALASRRLCLLLLGLAAAGPAAALVGGTDTTNFGQVSNGVQISPQWVLTAHHVGVGAVYSNAFGHSAVAARFNFSNAAFPEDDLSLLRLASPIAAPALSLWADLLPEGALSPLAATLVGRGELTPRAYGFSAVEWFLPRLDNTDDQINNPVPVNYLVTFSGIASGMPYVVGGDSGGGLFLGHVTDSSSPLMGIASARISMDDGVQASAYVHLAVYRQWIDGVLTGDGVAPAQVQWISSVPEPAAWALWLAGGIGLAMSLRKRAPR